MYEPAIAGAVQLDDVDRQLINVLQGGFPLCSRPYARVGEMLGISGDEVIRRIRRLLDERILTRFGPMFQVERLGGAFCLAAMQVPEADWARVVECVNAFPEVAHNYRREHALNMWFVLATGTQAGIAETAARIEAATGIAVHRFPKEREYFIDMRLTA